MKKASSMQSYSVSNGIVDKTRPLLCSNKRWLPFRSQWEKKFAENMTRSGIGWEYESESFSIDIDGFIRYWIPDFYLPELNIYVEISSHLRDSGIKRKKIKAFLAQYPLLKLAEISCNELDCCYEKLESMAKTSHSFKKSCAKTEVVEPEQSGMGKPILKEPKQDVGA